MFRNRATTLMSACFVGIGAYLGSSYEKWKNQHSDKPVYFPLTFIADTVHSAASVPMRREPNIHAGSVSALSSNTSLVMKYGFPSLDSLRSFDDYVLSYDRRNRNPNWVFEHLNPDKLNVKDASDRKHSNFIEDGGIHAKFRSTLLDYKRSGYDRGHMAAAANHRHQQQAMDQTFVLSNVSPQVGEGFNRGIWNSMEKYVRSIARKHKNTYVCTGPLYLPRKEADGKTYVKYEVIGDNHVAVPTHFFKVILIETSSGEFELLSFVLPNQPMNGHIKLKTFLVPIDTIERAAGFLFFDKFPLSRVKLINGKKQ